MADESIPTTPQGGHVDPGGGQSYSRGGRSSSGRDGGGREAGGFRIRLSDNEMQAARALQEAFGLRSTVAVLGFSLRTLAQQLEQGQLEGLIAQQRTQGGGRPPAARDGAKGGERRRDRFPGEREEGRGGRTARVDPFARPARPAAAAPEEEIAAADQSSGAEDLSTTEALSAAEPISADDTPADAPPVDVPAELAESPAGAEV